MENDSGDPVCPKCGAPFDLPPKNTLQLKPRTVLRDQYVIGRALGHGGFGVTYLAWDVGLEARLAVKEYLPNGVAGRASGETKVLPYSHQTQPEFDWGLDRFLEEARTLKKFSQYPGIVSVDTIFRDNGTAYLVMEYLDGWTLEEFLKRRGGKITFETALRIMLPVIDALSAVHADGVLHRDISPDNVILARDGKVKLIDFGAARNALGQKSRNLSIILKEGYAPEEQYRPSGIQGPWTDVYATAATIYHSITGARPESALDRLADDKVQPPSQMGIDIDSGAERALMIALSLKAADRFQSMEDFKAALSGSASITAMMRAVDPDAPLGGPIQAPTQALAPAPTQAPTQALSQAPTRALAPASSVPTPPPPPVPSPPHASPAAPVAHPPIPQPPIPQKAAGGPRWIVAVTLGLIALIAVAAAIVFHRRVPAPTQSQIAESPASVPTRDQPQPDNPTPDSSSSDPKDQPRDQPQDQPQGQPQSQPRRDQGTPGDPNLPGPANPPAPIGRPSPVAHPTPDNPSSPSPLPSPEPAPNPSGDPGVRGSGDYNSLIDQSKTAWANRQFPRVRMLLNQALTLDPNQPRAYSGLGELNLYVFDNVAIARRNDQAAIEHGGEAVFHVIHDHSGETFAVHVAGKLYVSATAVRYVPDSGPHAFNVKKSDVREVRKNRIMGVGIGRQKPADLHPFHIRLANGQNYNFAPTSTKPELERELILDLLGER